MTTVSSLEDMPAALHEKNIRIGTWDDIASQLQGWKSDTNATQNFIGIVNSASADADGQTDYHFFAIYAYRFLPEPPSGDPPPTTALARAAAGSMCACLDTDCICEGACENNCEPSAQVGVSEMASWCATTRCVSCRKYFIELRGCSLESVHECQAPPATMCCCVDETCTCEANCENRCEPSTHLGVSEFAAWCAATHCVRCRQYFLELRGCSSSPQCRPSLSSTIVGGTRLGKRQGRPSTMSSGRLVRQRVA